MVEARESDEYTKTVFVKIARSDSAAHQFFLDNPTQLELIGRYFIRQAEEIRNVQAHRKLESN